MNGCLIDGTMFNFESGPLGPFEGAVDYLGRLFLEVGKPVDTGHWQAMKGVPQTNTIEHLGIQLMYQVPETQDQLSQEVSPSFPWAELHFEERVAGKPVNPGKTYNIWPWYRGNVETHKAQGLFSHTYMERYWPRYAGQGPGEEYEHFPEDGGPEGGRQGIRYRYGDLTDVVSLLAQEPYTRQAYLPVWFPEDTGAHHGERVPCSLGYHFMLREGKLHCWYDIRSCDFLRHFRDDVYLTARLVQWVLSQLAVRSEPREEAFASPEEETWNTAVPGVLTMNMHSLHIFQGDLPKMKRLYDAV